MIPGIITSATEEMKSLLEKESRRLRQLAQTNPDIREEEIDLLENKIEDLVEHLGKTRLRIDAVRVVFRE